MDNEEVVVPETTEEAVEPAVEEIKEEGFKGSFKLKSSFFRK